MKTKQILAILTLGISIGFGVSEITDLQFSTEPETPRVSGIGGIFFKVENPQATREWYKEHLGLNTDQYGTNFQWRYSDNPDRLGHAQWSPFAAKTNYFNGDYMINYRVVNMEGLVKQLQEKGVGLLDSIKTYDYGKFVHIQDLNGTKVELWEPNDDAYAKYTGLAVTK